MIKTENLIKLLKKSENSSNLIHCITNPISINGSANIIISAGSVPIMAEHPNEVYEITEKSSALLINFGNITDTRMKSFNISAKCANENNIPVIVDAVGVSCSKLRLSFLKDFLNKYKVDVIKGNMSEIKALSGLENSALGIDAGIEDQINKDNIDNSSEIAKRLSQKYRSSVLITGKYDIISSCDETYAVYNGSEYLSKLTGTGCMLGALIACYLPYRRTLEAIILGTVLMGLAGENIKYKGPLSFQSDLLDYIYNAVLHPEILKAADFNRRYYD